MSVASELQNAVRAIRRDQAPDATMHHAVADLLDQVALTTPESVIESQASPITRKALAVARAYMSPGATPAEVAALREHMRDGHAVQREMTHQARVALHRQDHAGAYPGFGHREPVGLHTWAAKPQTAGAR